VFAVRRMLEAEMTREFIRNSTPARIQALKNHVSREKKALATGNAGEQVELLGDFHVQMAELTGNKVLAQILGELVSRCALITLMYQSASAAQHSAHEHTLIIKALASKDEEKAVRLMMEHLIHVEENLNFERKPASVGLAQALS